MPVAARPAEVDEPTQQADGDRSAPRPKPPDRPRASHGPDVSSDGTRFVADESMDRQCSPWGPRREAWIAAGAGLARRHGAGYPVGRLGAPSPEADDRPEQV